MKRPKIGVLPLYDTKKESRWNSIWMFPGYIDGMMAAGGMPYILPLIDDVREIVKFVDEFDGFLFTGGQDVDPQMYGQPMFSWCNEISPEKDHMESVLLKEVMARDKPLFGVCRGLQLINVVLGGTLHQDLERIPETTQTIQHNQKTSFIHPVHDIIIEPGTKLYDIVNKERIRVNSMHHQGVDTLGEGLTISAKAEDSLVEAVEIDGMRYGVAVQWHPEFLWQNRSYELDLWKSFVKEAEG